MLNNFQKISDNIRYQKIWENSLLSKPASSVQLLADFLEHQPPKQILDLGCGIGRHALFLAGKGHLVKAIDYNEEASNQLTSYAKGYSNLEVNFQSVIDFLQENSKLCFYDVVIMFDVLHHLSNSINVIIEMLDKITHIIKSGGLFNVTFLSEIKYSKGEFPEYRLQLTSLSLGFLFCHLKLGFSQIRMTEKAFTVNDSYNLDKDEIVACSYSAVRTNLLLKKY